MNTAVSLDINVFREAEREADHLRISVPEFCSMAIKEFVRNNEKSRITQQLDDFYSTHKAIIDDDILQAQYDLGRRRVGMVKGEIWRAHLPSARGSEPAKDRPVLVIQGDDYNSSKINTVICAVISSNLDLVKSTPNILLEKAHSHLKKSSVINFSQIITIDKTYFIKLICMLPKQFIEQIDKALISIFNINIKV